MDCIGQAGSWLPLVTVRQAFTHRDALAPVLLEAITRRGTAKDGRDIVNQRHATFGVFFLAQVRDPRLFDSLVQLLETLNPEVEDEWTLSGRLFFFGHRLLAGVCPNDAQRVIDLALNPALKIETRATAVSAIGLLGAYGVIARADAVRLLRDTFKPIKETKNDLLAENWARTAARLHCREFERELQWFLASGLLSQQCRHDIGQALRQDPDALLISTIAFEPTVDLFSNVFPQEIRNGEIGLLPNGEIPGLELFRGQEPKPRNN